MRKVFLDDLPRREGKSNQIDWKKSINKVVQFIYDDIEGKVEIVDYKSKGQYLYIKYQDKEIFKIHTNSFKNCNFGKLLGKHTNEFKIEINTHFKNDKRDLIIIDREYRKDKNGQDRKYYKYKCNKCGYDEGWLIEGDLIGKKIGCSCCCPSPRTVVEGINDIPTTALWMVKYFKNPEEANLYTKVSGQKINVICPDCGKIKKMRIDTLYNRKSIGCSCGDGVSYPEKIMFSALEQLGLNFKTQLNKTTFKWCGKYKYDFYFEFNNEQCIVETHGIQHYEQTSRKGSRSLEEERDNDRIKKELAIKNGVKEDNYIVIDCSESDLEWIKKNVLNSRLNELLDLNRINWLKCEKYSLNNLVKIACELKRDNPNMGSNDIGNIMKLSKVTIINYLKKGSKIWDWISYNPKEEIFKNGSRYGKMGGKQVEIFKDGLSLGIFPSCSELERQSEELFEIKLLHCMISEVCLGKNPQYKGFIFKYV